MSIRLTIGLPSVNLSLMKTTTSTAAPKFSSNELAALVVLCRTQKFTPESKRDRAAIARLVTLGCARQSLADSTLYTATPKARAALEADVARGEAERLARATKRV